MLKKLKYKILATVLLVSFTLPSCNKWLELQPQDGLIRQEYWKTKEQLDAAVMGCYASLLGGSGLQMPLVKYLFMWGELRADMVVSAYQTNDEDEESLLGALTRDQLNMMRADLTSTNMITNWAAVYRTINYCNTVIKFGPEVMESDKTLTEADLKAYLSEAYALRGLMYFYLLRSFEQVPLKLSPTSSDNDVQPMEKSSAAQIAEQIISDLRYATEHAKVSYPNLMEDRGRINKYGAFAILADVYLWQEDYQGCLDACNQVISSGKYQLLPFASTKDDWYQTVFFNGNSIEGIFEFQFDRQIQNPFYSMFSTEFRTAGWIVNGNLYGVDPQGNEEDIRGNEISFSEATSFITKYNALRSSSESFAHWFAYRYADVLLMKAEALTFLEPGNPVYGSEAIAIVNDIRFRRNALAKVGEKTITEPQSTETSEIATYILEERSRELAFEGKRWYDILRFAKRNNYAYENILIDMVTASAPADRQQSIINKYRDRRSHYLPIYFKELQTNKALVQNSFYQ